MPFMLCVAILKVKSSSNLASVFRNELFSRSDCIRNCCLLLFSDVPPLLPINLPHEEEEVHEPEEHVDEEVHGPQSKFVSGPKQPNPFASQDQSTILLPLFITAACFIPVVFCLCKLC